MTEITFKAHNEYQLNLMVWDKVEKPKGIVQFVHGMADHIKRYDDFANFLNAKGYIVLGDDHRAHGITAKGNLGIVPVEGDCFEDTVKDLISITNYAKATYPNLPFFIMGHSYGSFLVQSYIQENGKNINGAIVCASARQNTLAAKFGRLLANVQVKLLGKDKTAKLIDKLSFGSFNNKFKSENQDFAWVTRDKVHLQKYINDPMCGYTMSIGFYSSFFNGLHKIYKKENLNKIPKKLPLLLISGDKDPVGGFSKLTYKLLNQYKNLNIENIQLVMYPDARHEILNEINNEQVYNDMYNFIENNNKK